MLIVQIATSQSKAELSRWTKPLRRRALTSKILSAEERLSVKYCHTQIAEQDSGDRKKAEICINAHMC